MSANEQRYEIVGTHPLLDAPLVFATARTLATANAIRQAFSEEGNWPNHEWFIREDGKEVGQ